MEPTPRVQWMAKNVFSAHIKHRHLIRHTKWLCLFNHKYKFPACSTKFTCFLCFRNENDCRSQRRNPVKRFWKSQLSTSGSTCGADQLHGTKNCNSIEVDAKQKHRSECRRSINQSTSEKENEFDRQQLLSLHFLTARRREVFANIDVESLSNAVSGRREDSAVCLDSHFPPPSRCSIDLGSILLKSPMERFENLPTWRA